MDRLRSEIEELFDELWQRAALLRPPARVPAAGRLQPHGEPAELHVVVELPGVDPETSRSSSTATTLVVSQACAAAPRRAGRYRQVEIEYGPVLSGASRSARTSTPAAARSTYERGMLTVVLPVATQPAQPQSGGPDRQIEVRRAVSRRPRTAELPAVLPVLPLKETVVFPQSMTPLAIGQERSVRLDRRRRRRRPDARARRRAATPTSSARAGTTSTTSAPRPSSTR